MNEKPETPAARAFQEVRRGNRLEVALDGTTGYERFLREKP